MNIDYKKLVDDISQKLDNRKDINKWSLAVSYAKSIEIGLKDNNVGGLYRSPSAQMAQSLEIYIYWKDHTRSIHTFNGKFPEINDTIIDDFKKQSFYDDIIPDLPKAQEIKEIKVYDENVENLFSDSSYIFESISSANEKLANISQNLNGSTGATIGNLYVKNSEGFNNYYKLSDSGIYIIADNIFAMGESTRKLYNSDDIDFVVDMIKKYLPYYNKKAEKGTLKSGKLEVIIPYSDFLNMFSFYIFQNLSAEAIDINQSIFSIDDIKNEKKIMRDDFVLTIDNTKDYKTGSHRFSSFGNPAGKQIIIKDGKIISPLIGFKYAKKFGFKPTPDILSEESLELKNGNIISFEDAYKNIKEGLIIDGTLGLHTQDHTTGNYSLNCQSSLFIKNGEIAGKGNVLINGNFFEDIMSGDIQLIKHPRRDFPGVKLSMDVSVIDS